MTHELNKPEFIVQVNEEKDCHKYAEREEVSSHSSDSSDFEGKSFTLTDDTTKQDNDWQLVNEPTSYYDILVSKFIKSTHDPVELKQETSHNLELLKEQSEQTTDWGKGF